MILGTLHDDILFLGNGQKKICCALLCCAVLCRLAAVLDFGLLHEEDAAMCFFQNTVGFRCYYAVFFFGRVVSK